VSVVDGRLVGARYDGRRRRRGRRGRRLLARAVAFVGAVALGALVTAFAVCWAAVWAFIGATL
jgi:fatty acid desaturase